MIGTCGDSCLDCPRYIATRSGSTEKLEHVKAWWVRLGLRNPAFPVKDMACPGCRPENACAYPEVRTCALERGIGNCGLCEAYPCGLIAAVFERTEGLRRRAVAVCKAEELKILDKAFFLKRQNLDRIRFERNRQKK
jgi:hypothetical protein